jgi:hypothetical protein
VLKFEQTAAADPLRGQQSLNVRFDRGFIMRFRYLPSAFVFCCGLFVSTAPSAPQQGEPAKGKPSPDRLKGMKAALADIEAGRLKLKIAPFSDAKLQSKYTALLLEGEDKGTL